jgi:hypothetical protein
MSTTKQLTRHQLDTGNFIGRSLLASDIDTPDSILWMEIVEVLFVEGFRKYRVMFPGGEVAKTLISAKSVLLWQ